MIDTRTTAWAAAPSAMAVAMAVTMTGLAAPQEAPPAAPAAPEAAPVAEPPQVDAPAEAASTEEAGPRPIAPADYGRWESIGGGFRGSSGALSPDARWIAYSINRVNGDDELRVRMLATDEVKVFAHGSRPEFSSDARWLAFSIGMSEKDREAKAKRKEPVRNKLGLLDLRDGTEIEVEDVADFSFSDDGRFLVMRCYPIEGRESGGADLVLRDLLHDVDTAFGNVGQHAFNDDGLLLAMTIETEGSAGNGVQLYDAATGRLRTLDSHEAKYTGLTWREDGRDLAVMREMEHEDDEDVSHTIVAWHDVAADAPVKTIYAHQSDESFPADLRVTTFSGLRWSDDGRRLFFGVKAWEKKPKALEADGDAGTDADGGADADADADADKDKGKGKGKGKGEGEDKAKEARPLRETIEDPSNVEVWHARDIDIIPLQKRTASRDERRTHMAVLHVGEPHSDEPHSDEPRVVVLGDDLTEDVELLEGDRHAIGLDNTPYETEKRFGPTLHDIYAIELATGSRTKLLERVKYHYGSDPTGRRLLFVRDGHVWAHDIAANESVNLTAAVDTPFINQEMSSLTDEKPPYGMGGWTEDGGHVLLYDRFDMFLFAADGDGVQRLTRGRDDWIVHRRVIVDRDDEEFVTLDAPMWVSLYGERSKRSGYGRLAVGGRLERLIYEDASVGAIAKAEDEDAYTLLIQDFDDSPDIFLADATMADPKQVSETNPFQTDFLWGRSELVSYTSRNGDELQGALFYPADYEPGKQYPMIVDIYELRSRGVHRYSTPSERSAYNTAVFTAEGYFVYTPDIVYRAQNPGLSAVECVIPAVEAVIEMGVVDRDRIGLVGHSWGAYQTAFIVTQTDLFAAGIAGAPLTNMMSMSMSIYWNSGQTDAWIFHESQGRMDQPFWQDVDTYIANSPIFSIDAMNTPLMIAFGTEDGAVDFNQGVEMYNAARLAEKQFVMLVYPGENHGLRRKENQVDYHYRILEWFGHYLKGDEAPAWITEGQSWLDRQKEVEAKKPNGGGGGRGGRR